MAPYVQTCLFLWIQSLKDLLGRIKCTWRVVDVLRIWNLYDALVGNSGDVLQGALAQKSVFSYSVSCFIALCGNVNNDVRVELNQILIRQAVCRLSCRRSSSKLVDDSKLKALLATAKETKRAVLEVLYPQK